MGTPPPLHLNDLPHDTLYIILKSLPTFSSLFSLILSHRAFNETWKANHKHIKRCIASTQFEPLGSALKLLTLQRDPDSVNYTLDEILDIWSEPPILNDPTKLSSEELARMISNMRFIDFLENSTAQRPWVQLGLDPIPANEVTGPERFRYRRAIYRVWLLALALRIRHRGVKQRRQYSGTSAWMALGLGGGRGFSELRVLMDKMSVVEVMEMREVAQEAIALTKQDRASFEQDLFTIEFEVGWLLG